MKHHEQPELQSDILNQYLNELNPVPLIDALGNMHDSVVIMVLNQSQQIVFCSKNAKRIIGMDCSNLLGRACPTEIAVSEHIAHGSEMISLDQPYAINLRKSWQVIQNSSKTFSGAVVMLREQNPDSGNPPLHEGYRTTKHFDFHGIISRSPAMRPVFQLIQNAAKTEATVLVRGESGSGKELVAHAIHDLSPRQSAPFLAINCAALSATLLESELFGHVKGAFTGAIRDHSGLFERAKGGTLFLDEVAEIPLELQAKLLRVIQERNFMPVGATHSVYADVRIVAATHRSLREEVKAGTFREDLMYRLRVVPIFIPPLRDRREDINLLLWHFIKQHNDHNLRLIEKIEPQAMRVLLDYPWPGNIRELQNVVEYAFAVGRGSVLKLSELPPEFRENPMDRTASAVIPSLSPEQEESAIRQALEHAQGKVSLAAGSLGMSRATFWRKRKHYGI